MSYEPITIVHLITELNMGGAEQMLYKLVTRMDHNRFRCIVVSMTDQGPVGERIKAKGIPVFPLGMGFGRPTLKGVSTLFYLLKQESVNIVQSWLYHADLLGLIVGRIAGIKRVVWGIRCSDLHLSKYRPLTALTVRASGILSPLADAIVVNSENGMRVHKKRGYQTERMVFIPNGFDTERFCPDASAKTWLIQSLGIPPDAILIGQIARFDPMKDHKTFLKAASLLARQHPEVHFVLVGRGLVPENADLAFLINHHLEGRIHLLGLRDDIPRITAALDIVSSSSAFGEGFSNTIGEAMSCGVPCVVTDVGDSALIVDGTGIVVQPEDPEALADAWIQMLKKGEDGRKDAGEQARVRVVKNYSIEKIVQRFEDLYVKLAHSS